MVDPVRVQSVSVVGRLVAPDPKLERIFFSFNADFSGPANIIFDMNSINQKDVFGGPVRALFMDNSSNPNEVTVYVQGTDQFFTVPAYAQGVFQISANMNTIITFETEGGASDQITITLYNWEVSPSVWYRYGAISKDIPLKVQGAYPDGEPLPEEFGNGVLIAGVDPDGNVLKANVDALGNLVVSNLDITIGAVYGPDDTGTPPTRAPLFVGGIDPDGNIIPLKLNASGEIIVDFTGTGLATEAKQDDIIDIISRPGGSAITSVPDAAVDTLILASNVNRKGAAVFNDSTEILYLVLDNDAASLTVFTVKIQADGYYEIPFGYTGEVRGIWAANAAGAARVTEIS